MLSYNPFDPIQDTERVQHTGAAKQDVGYNPFDPIQDTERAGILAALLVASLLQPIRSDTGY